MDYSNLEKYSAKQLKSEVIRLKIKNRTILTTKEKCIEALKNYESISLKKESEPKKNVPFFPKEKEPLIFEEKSSVFDYPSFNYKINDLFINHIKLLTEITNEDVNKLSKLLSEKNKPFTIQSKKLIDLLDVPKSKELLETFFTHLYPYQTFIKSKKELREFDLSKTNDGKILDSHTTSYSPYIKTKFTVPDFDVQWVNALFFDPEVCKYKYYKISIRKSTIKKAGMGAYAEENIPIGLYGFYNGIYTTVPNELYTWSIFKFDMINGEILDDNQKETKYSIDAFDIRTSNWTRYVNCAVKNNKNNMFAIQSFHIMLYKTMKNIKKGEELFIDYGEGYRTDHLGIDDTKY